MKRTIACTVAVLLGLAGCGSSPGHKAHDDAAMEVSSDGMRLDSDLDGDGGADSTFLVYAAELNGTISVYRSNAALDLEPVGSATKGTSMRFLAFFRPSATRLYAVNESRIDAFSLESDLPSFLGSAAMAAQGTHLEVDHSGRWIIAVSFQGNTIQIVPVQANGVPSAPSQTFGAPGEPDFCKRPHQVRIHPQNRWVYIPCRDSDHVVRFALDSDTGVLTSLGQVATPAGTGPRHMDFHPSLDIVYVIGENSSHVVVYTLNPTSGALSQKQDISTLPPSITEGSLGSDIHVSPDGNYVYAINRGSRNELVIMKVHADGTLSRQSALSTHGTGARTFAPSPDGRWLVVGNTTSPNLATFSVNNATGDLAFMRTYTPFNSNVFYVGVRP